MGPWNIALSCELARLHTHDLRIIDLVYFVEFMVSKENDGLPLEGHGPC